jgi:Tol biopolymer transport system component
VILAKDRVPHLRTLAPSGHIVSDVRLPVTKRPTIYTITYYDGLSWSPDGRWVGTELGRGGGYVGYLLMHPDGTARRLVFRTYDHHDAPDVSWSPDGTQLAVWTEGRDPRDPNVAVLNARSGAVHRLHMENAGPPAWSPDSDRLVFSIYRRGVLIVSAQGKVIKTIKRARASSPVWSPDGTTIAFLDGRQVVTAPVASGSAQIVATLPSEWTPWRLEWQRR